MCTGMDLTRYRQTLHAHDFTPGGNSRVVMIRKKEQRTFASSKIGQETKFETLTKETIQTFRGNKIERKITSQKRDSQEANGEFIKKFSHINVYGETDRKKPPPSDPSSPSYHGTNSSQKKAVIRKKSDHPIFAGAEDFAIQCLRAHNEKRSLHKSPPLKLSKKLCKYSEEWARHLASKGEMLHRSESSYGENLFLIWISNPSQPVTGDEPVHHWYSEIKDHAFMKEPQTLKTGHFTQVVWMESRELGVGVASSRNGQVFVVCNYEPPGNFLGTFSENVPPLGGFTEVPKTMASEVKNDEEFLNEGMKVHNDFRAKHGSPPLKLSKQLNDYAQEWAMKLAKENKFEHRQSGSYGENLFSMSSTEIASAKDACVMWYSESKGYQYGAEPKTLKSGHFTQLIWKGSRELGMGRAKGSNGYVYIVANYNPRGNIVGEFSANVEKPH